MKMRKAVVSFALLSFAALISACGDSISDRAARDETVSVGKDDPAMLKAFDKARQSLPDFLEKAANPPTTLADFSVKVRISENDAVEYFWVIPFTRSGDSFTGTLANDGQLIPKYRAGQSVTFAQTDIVDWLYRDSETNAMKGNYTACALLTHEDSSEAEKFKAEYGLECSDI